MARDKKKPVEGSGAPARTTVVAGRGMRRRWSAAHVTKRRRLLAVAVILLLLLGTVAAGYAGWRYYVDRKNGIINADTYAWPTTEKGRVKDRIGVMTDQQKAEYFYSLAFEYKNTNKSDDARAAVKVSLQYRTTLKALLLAAALAESTGDFAAAVAYYQQAIELLQKDTTPSVRNRVEQYQKRIDDLHKQQSQPPPAPPAKQGSEVSA